MQKKGNHLECQKREQPLPSEYPLRMCRKKGNKLECQRAYVFFDTIKDLGSVLDVSTRDVENVKRSST